MTTNRDYLLEEISLKRANLNLELDFDTSKSNIWLYIDNNNSKFVKVVRPKGEMSSYSDTANYYAGLLVEAAKKWDVKYQEDMPQSAKFAEEPINIGAWRIPYEGKTKLTKKEQDFISNSRNLGDVSIDMLWLIIDGIGWRPGSPVNEIDEGWMFIWGEEQLVSGYLDVTRGFLRMPEKPIGFFPPVVAEIYCNCDSISMV